MSRSIVLILASWAVYLASFIGMLKVFPCGFGKHLWSVTEEQLQCYMKELLFLGVTYFWPPTLAKLSLIVLYHRLNPNTGYRVALYVIAFVITTYTIVFTAILSGPCNPLDVGSSTCLNNVALAQAVLNISTDGVLVLMPVVMLWGLNMPRKQKVAVGCILALGSGAVIASCVRIAYVRAMINNPDVLYTQGSAAVWSAVEINIGILCNCLAMLKPFVRRHLPWLISLVGSDGSSSEEGKAKDSAARFGRFRRSSAKSGGNGAGGCVGAGAGNYQLHSFGRDKEACKFGEGDGRSTTVTSRSDTLKTPDDLAGK
ncbi:putative integral membrane protein [Diaporthe ampelina]|uniref:Putative integral membrane protein n=1 Tax=Diaporthe ampelina TaxID=1214573 RepID=A0A0G2IFK5_9PEZI|nr:putative integral membrane protein [Diaporthe ampelina]